MLLRQLLDDLQRFSYQENHPILAVPGCFVAVLMFKPIAIRMVDDRTEGRIKIGCCGMGQFSRTAAGRFETGQQQPKRPSARGEDTLMVGDSLLGRPADKRFAAPALGLWLLKPGDRIMRDETLFNRPVEHRPEDAYGGIDGAVGPAHALAFGAETRLAHHVKPRVDLMAREAGNPFIAESLRKRDDELLPEAERRGLEGGLDVAEVKFADDGDGVFVLDGLGADFEPHAGELLDGFLEGWTIRSIVRPFGKNDLFALPPAAVGAVMRFVFLVLPRAAGWPNAYSLVKQRLVEKEKWFTI